MSSTTDTPSSWFASDRERRLWIGTGVVLLAIFSTLGLATKWAGMIQDRGLEVSAFVLGMALVFITVVTQGLKARPSGLELCVGLGIFTAYFMIFVRMVIPTERSHLIEYGIVAVFVYEALLERASQGRRVFLPAVLAILITTLIGAVDECVQGVLPSRTMDPQDILFNFLAALMSISTSLAMRGTRWLLSRLRPQPSNSEEDK